MRQVLPTFERFRRFPFWTQAGITLGSVGVLIALWSACGGSPSPPPPPAPPPLARPLSSPRVELKSHYGVVSALAFSPTGEWLASGTSDKTVRLWNVSEGEVLRAFKGHSDIVTSLAVTPQGKMLATASADKTAKLWDVFTGREIHTLLGHTGPLTSVAFSADGRWLATASQDKTIRLWDSLSGRQLHVMSGHTDKINAIAFGAGDRLLASASDDKSVRLWNPGTGDLARILTEGDGRRVVSLAFSPDGKFLATGSALVMGFGTARRGKIDLWNLETGNVSHTFGAVLGTIQCLAFSPDGKLLASGREFSDMSIDSEIVVWRVATQEVVSKWNAERGGQLNAIAYSPDGRWLASGGTSGRIRLWQ